ncbi:hypothetical protein D3C76_888130 [compost metagenome]
MIVGIDIDDTLNEFSLVLAECYKAETGMDALPGIRKHFFLEEATGMTGDDVINFFQRNHAALYERTPVKEYLPHMLEAMTRRNMVIHIVTNRMDSRREVTLDWLHDNNLSPYIDQLYMCGGCKHEFVTSHDIKLDVIVEDRLDKVKPFLKAKIPAVLFNYEHNQGFDHPLLYRVNNWFEAFEALCRIQITSKAWMR